MERQNTQECIELRMPMTGNDTIGARNNAYYEVYRTYLNRTSSEVARFDVSQVWGQKRYEGNVFVLEEKPETRYGLFIVQKYEYSSGSKKRTMGISFTQKGAHAFAQSEALRYAKRLTKEGNLSDVVNRIDEDMTELRRKVKN